MSDFVDYLPHLGGQSYDPADNGGEVSTLRLYATPARDGLPVATAGPAEKVATGHYRFTVVTALPPGRYYGEFEWTKDATSDPFVDAGDRIDLPFDPTLLCSIEDVATKLGVTLPVTAEQRETIRDAILDAQADVEDYLNRPLVAQPRTFTAAWPRPGYTLEDYRAWPEAELYDDKVQVLKVTALPEGGFTVDALVGLDGRNVPGIVRYVKAAAAEALRNDPAAAMGKRVVTSVSAEGQSISYESSSTAEGAAGSKPNIKSLRRWRRYSVSSRQGAQAPPWPYMTAPVGWTP